MLAKHYLHESNSLTKIIFGMLRKTVNNLYILFRVNTHKIYRNIMIYKIMKTFRPLFLWDFDVRSPVRRLLYPSRQHQKRKKG